ncbi:hypothetical protein FJT64_023998 [Amphibalanus amphitrite]|uniref:Uncharacterized protein n=1 Tax=Amphibalanus amphitrite TaxID=1232801 RepID=A0A6A4WFT8_AMPAM|nr:hypothetical protein FJT64_023998 [Amphibalanus amphitrite]
MGPTMADYTGIFGPKKPVATTTSQGGGGGVTRHRTPRRPAAAAAGAGAAGALPWLLLAALAVLGPAPAAGHCQCGLLVMLESTGSRPWTLGETVMESGPRPADCRLPSAEIDCLNSCANTTSVPNTIVERIARRLSVGGFYRYCSHDWMHTGVVFPDKICCLENKVVE